MFSQEDLHIASLLCMQMMRAAGIGTLVGVEWGGGRHSVFHLEYLPALAIREV